MMDTRKDLDGWRQHAFMLALIACIFRALVPVGFMLDERNPGHMVICSGTEIQKSIDTNPAQPHGDKSHNDICGFSVNTGGVTADADILIMPPLFLGTYDAIVTASLISQNPPVYASRAPPVSFLIA